MDEAVQELQLVWARLRVDVDCGLRRGTWYRVSRFTPTEIFVDVQHSQFAVPRRLLDLVIGRPTRWSVVPRQRKPAGLPPDLGAPYAVCPGCRVRTPLEGSPAKLTCPRCLGDFAVAWDERYLSEDEERAGITPEGS